MNQAPNGYSADVDIKLVVGDRVLDVAQVLREEVILRDAIDAPPGPVELVLTIDGREHRRAAELADGLRATERHVRLRFHG
jgi:hypothetical protein